MIPENIDTENNNTRDSDSDDVSNSDTAEAMLSDIEARILGSLMEKQRTTPDAYPLTCNSLLLACNQKTSREPTMELNESEVLNSLNDLQKRALVKVEFGSRSDKYEQRLSRELHLNDAEHAIFCLMLLRGPQTFNELLTRTRRLYEFSDDAELSKLLEKLLTRTKPLIMKMPHQSGQREDRYMHLLCGTPKTSHTLPANQSNIESQSQLAQSSPDELVARIEELEKQVAWLMENKNISE